MTLAAIACSVWLTATPALPANIQGEQRTQVLLAHIEAAERDTAIWYWAWNLGYAAGTVVNFALWPVTPVSERPSLITWGIASGLGAIFGFIFVPTAMGAKKRAATDGAEKIWVDLYDEEVGSRGWLPHTIAVLINVIPYLVLGFAYHRWEQELPTMLSGILIGEAQIFTFPQLLRRFGVLR